MAQRTRDTGPDPVEAVREICLSLPEVEERPFGGHEAPAFRVADKIFVKISEDLASFTCKAPAGAQEALVGGNPVRFFVPAYVGHKGWIGVNLIRPLDLDEVVDLIEESYRLTAPRRLAALLEAS